MYSIMVVGLSVLYYYQHYKYWNRENISVVGRLMTPCLPSSQTAYIGSFPPDFLYMILNIWFSDMFEFMFN